MLPGFHLHGAPLDSTRRNLLGRTLEQMADPIWRTWLAASRTAYHLAQCTLSRRTFGRKADVRPDLRVHALTPPASNLPLRELAEHYRSRKLANKDQTNKVVPLIVAARYWW